MLTDQDIQKLIEVFATREEVATKKDLEEIRKDFANLQTAVDNYAKRAEVFFQEMVVLTHRVNRHEKWLHQIADKLQIKLDY